MTEQTDFEPTPVTPDITSDDKLWAALGYPVALVALIMLLMEDKKARPFIKYHAVQALAVNLLVSVLAIVLTLTAVGACLVPFLWLALLWPAYVSYQGKYMELPLITDFLKGQGWV